MTALLIQHVSGAQDHDLQIVHLAALLHDVGDWKYSSSMEAGAHRVQVQRCSCLPFAVASPTCLHACLHEATYMDYWPIQMRLLGLMGIDAAHRHQDLEVIHQV